MPLEIYKASAGSGKTFRIVREYLELVFQRPGAYKNILAITFTNKASAEMKDRILTDLSKLSSGKPSPHLEHLKNKFRKNENEIRQTAAQILKLILHDYSRFSVSTIDSLFQRLIRAFSREMHLSPSYRTEIETQQVLEEAIDRLFIEIDENQALRKWMLEYAEKNLEEGRKWNLTGDLIARGSELFREEFKLFSEPLLAKLADKNYLSRYSRALKEINDEYKSKLKEIGRKGLDLISHYGLTVDQFKYGASSFAKHFQKLADGNFDPPGPRTIDACNNPDSWSKSTDSADLSERILSVYEAGLNEMLVRSVEIINNEGIAANSANAILSNLFSFGLLTDIALKIQEVSREKNIVLLSDSTQILRKVISDSDSPFVYEKIGSVYRHFMLDEFQDTSRMQWHNLRPLIENSLAEGNKNIVVGDVKQSIYRWRNGDWDLLASQVEKDLFRFGTTVVPLMTNWRSSKNIISFNNILFRQSALLINEDFDVALNASGQSIERLAGMKGMINNVYADHFQQFSDNASDGGYIKVQFLDLESRHKKNEFREAAIAEMIAQIEAVQDSGVPPGKIAILVRSKNDGALVAKALLDKKSAQTDNRYCYDVISNDSLIISQSPVVRFILNFFSLFVNPENDIVKADLIYSYYNYLSPKTEGQQKEENKADLHSQFAIHDRVPDIFKPWFRQEDDSSDEGLLSLPLFTLAAKIVNAFGLDKIAGELVYLEAFLDLALQYGKDETGGIQSFLDWWKISGSEKTITLPEGQDSITILTIHKAKGLEFHMVLVPFCDWEIVPQGNKAPYLWCRPDREPFNLLDLVLVRYGKELQRSIFSEAYYKEMLYTSVDNLNLLYVAFTRAVNSLIVFCPYTPDLKRPYNSVSSLLQGVIEKPPMLDSIDLKKYINITENWDPENRVFEYDTLNKFKNDDSEISSLKKELSFFRLEGGDKRLKLRIHSEGYFDLYNNETTARIGYGRLLHELFENITTMADIKPSLQKMISGGKVDSRTADEYQEVIYQLLAPEPYKSWFSGDWKVLNERDILRGDENRHRPDRIMMKENEVVLLDYKTGFKSDRYNSQVKGYIKDFERMGYKNLKGYLWYLNENELIEVI
jgi:ATP-dependent helicase/nuclease subunit A